MNEFLYNRGWRETILSSDESINDITIYHIEGDSSASGKAIELLEELIEENNRLRKIVANLETATKHKEKQYQERADYVPYAEDEYDIN